MDFNSMTTVDSCTRRNKRKAYFAMCRVSLLLCFVTLFSWISGTGIKMLFSHYSVEIQGAVVKLLANFGIGTQTAFVTAKNILESGAFNQILSTFITLFTMVLPCMIFASCSGLTFGECFGVEGKLIKPFFPMFCLCQIITVTVSVYSGTIYKFVFPDGDPTRQTSAALSPDGGFDVFAFVIRILCVCIFVPVAEEYVFRGVMFSALRKYGLQFALVASSVLFGVAHLSPTQSVYAFMFGILSAFFVVVTGNIKTSIILHALNNLITVLAEYMPSCIGEVTVNIFYGIYTVVIAVFAFYGLYRLVMHEKYIDVFAQKAEENDGGLVIKPGLFQIAVLPLIVYLCYYAYTVASGVLL